MISLSKGFSWLWSTLLPPFSVSLCSGHTGMVFFSTTLVQLSPGVLRHCSLCLACSALHLCMAGSFLRKTSTMKEALSPTIYHAALFYFHHPSEKILFSASRVSYVSFLLLLPSPPFGIQASREDLNFFHSRVLRPCIMLNNYWLNQ